MNLLDELERLDKAASSSPWYVTEKRDYVGPWIARHISTQSTFEGGMRETDAELAVAARNALPTLIALLREARELAEHLNKRYGNIMFQIDSSQDAIIAGMFYVPEARALLAKLDAL